MVYKNQLVQRDLHYAIIDEVDSVLIDEARTPLIISGQGDESTELYQTADRFAKGLSKDDYIIEEKDKQISLSESGVRKCESFFKIDNSKELKDIKIVGYEHMGKISFPIAQ